ncbi:MAG: glycosyltransferase [Gammaproteobacteria bacterium]
MATMMEEYAGVAGEDVIDHLQQLARRLKGMKVVHVNSTRLGGGVAEILTKLVPLMGELGLDASWEVITGDDSFFQCTKAMHNALQGNRIKLSREHLQAYTDTNEYNAEKLRHILDEADFVFIHDPQPAALLQHFPKRKGKWIWRCHIDASSPHRPVWRIVQKYVRDYDASIFSLPQFAQALPCPEYIIPPSIDPLSEKNIDLPEQELMHTYEYFGLDRQHPIIVQVSRYDRFKDPLGVIEAYRHAKKFLPTLQLVLAGGGATDDPEGDIVLQEVREAAADDEQLKVLVLPPDAHRTINALQRIADIVLQKSLREGFGLTVTEAMWKGKPVIGGNAGGIRLQVVNFHTGFLVTTPEGAALRIRYLLHQRDKMAEMGFKARQFVKENFLITRHLREYLTLMVGIQFDARDRIELD